ncbi:MAG: DNA-directed RNA polymerase subunit omega [Pyrinomonadaceae bacterium]
MAAKAKETAPETEEVDLTKIDPPEIDSKYRLIILAAQRSKQLQRGAQPRVDADLRKTKPTRVALKEISERKVNFEILDAEKQGR